jgi:TolA-binding protein
MKKILSMVLLLVLLPGMALAADDKTDNVSVSVKSEQQSVFKGFLYSVWGKLRALSPRLSSHNSQRAVATAGIRGAETTTSLISPYWKDDRTEDPEYIRELTEFTKAQQLAENGDLQAAVTALNDFIGKYEKSDLKPNAQFALGISYGGLGQKAGAIKALQAFVSDNPEHPLVADAKQVIAQLK